MNEILSFLLGFTCAFMVAAFIGWREWENRERLERKVDRLYKHLSCGQGILGCTAGPNCHWDHK